MKEKNNFLINLIINKRKIIEKVFIILVIISVILQNIFQRQLSQKSESIFWKMNLDILGQQEL